jgi:hypothetical protein
MRWTDLPPDRDPADGAGSALTRDEWDDLRQRLERLPPGHPSRPDEAELADGDAADQDSAGADQSGARRDVPEEEKSRGRAPVVAREAGGRREHDAGRPVPGGGREPYRPWFTAGEPPEPWFAADPGQ